MANYATSALKLSDTYVNTLPYNTCSTAAGTAAKAVSAGDFSLETGAMVVVKFTVTNTAANPTLNVSSTGAKAIYYNGAAITAGYLKANKVYQFIYNGTQWDLVGDTDTHYTTALRLGASGTNSNAEVTSPYIKVLDNTTYRSQIRLLSGNGLNFKSDASANVTVSPNEVTISVPTTGWTTDTVYGNKVTITASGVNANTNPVADVVLNGSTLAANKTLLEQWSYISKITTASGSVTLYAFDQVPTSAFSILLKFV